MMLNLSQLRSFQSIYRLGSFSKAAEHLNLTQPALSKQIRQLEQRLGHTLFTRLPRGIAATPAAHELSRRIGPHLDALESLSDTFKLGGLGLAGTVYLGGPSEFLGAKVLPALADLHEENILLRVKLGQPETLLEELQAGALDMFVSTVRLSRPGLETTALYLEELVLVGNAYWANKLPTKQLATKGADLLSQTPLLAYSEELPLLRRFWRKTFGKVPDATATLVIPDLRAIVQSAKTGAGVTVIPRYLVEDELGSGELLELYKALKPSVNQLYLVSQGKKVHARVAYVRDRILRSAQSW
jgi:DNA-binding transcriptional LysR family regulator